MAAIVLPEGTTGIPFESIPAPWPAHQRLPGTRLIPYWACGSRASLTFSGQAVRLTIAKVVGVVGFRLAPWFDPCRAASDAALRGKWLPDYFLDQYTAPTALVIIN